MFIFMHGIEVAMPHENEFFVHGILMPRFFMHEIFRMGERVIEEAMCLTIKVIV